MYSKFSDETKKVLSSAKMEMINLNHPYLGSEHLMLGILKNNNNVSNYLKKEKITYNKFLSNVIKIIGKGTERKHWVLYTPIVKEILERAIDISDDKNEEVSVDDLFISLIEIGDCIANRVLCDMKIDLEKLYTDFVFKIPKKNKKKKTIIDDIGFELTNKSSIKKFDPVYGREKEINKIIEILIRKNKSNPLLIGDAGVGKTAIVEEISRLIVEGKVPNKLKNKRIISIDMSSAVAGTKYRGEFEEKLNKIIKEAESDDEIILFIDEIHTIVGAGGAEGAIDASNIFKPALARGNIKCIGATTIDEYKKYIEKDKALERRFKKIIIEEPTIDEVKSIIYKLKPIYENFHHVSINDNIISLLITLTNKYIKNYKNPDKTIDVLDEVCAHANLKENENVIKYNKLLEELNEVTNLKKEKILSNDFKKAFEYKQQENFLTSSINELEYYLSTTHYNSVTKKDLLYVLKSKVNSPIIELDTSFNKLKILNKLQSSVIDQEYAIKKLVNSYFESRKLDSCFSVLLTGSTGVGKTKLATEFANVLSSKILRLDMSEFSESHSISKLVGAPPGYAGYDDNNYLFESIKEYPFTVIILDEIEKCNKSVLNLFNQILDNNELKDSKGNIIHFNNTVIIMTTNIIKDKNIGFKKVTESSNINDYFDNSFLNRINEIIKLEDLQEKSIIKIVKSYLKNINCKLCDNEMLSEIILKSNYQKYGARQLKNIVNKLLNDKKTKKIVKNYSKN